jgi:hypothetical protein
MIGSNLSAPRIGRSLGVRVGVAAGDMPVLKVSSLLSGPQGSEGYLDPAPQVWAEE